MKMGLNQYYSNMFKTAVIAIGGKGTRLQDLTKKIPKPLFPIAGKSTLSRAIEQLNNYKINEIILTTCYEYSQFKNEIKNIKENYASNIKVFKENYALGECGALWYLQDSLRSDFLFINGDLIFSFEIEKFFNFHKDLSSDLTLVSHPSTHPEDSDILSAPNGTLVKSLFFKNQERNPLSGYLGNAGIAAISPKLLKQISPPSDIKFSSLFSHLVKESVNKNIRVFTYNTSEYIRDIGTIDRFKNTEKEIKNGYVENKNFSKKQKVLFLDRDNTLIKCDKDKYILTHKEVKIIQKNVEKIANIAKKYNSVIVITNQPQISMNLLSISELDKIHTKIFKDCLEMNLFIDEFIFCPHHPHGGYNNELTNLKFFCFCRKPNPGMILEQAFKKNISLQDSLFIGDSSVDEEASKRANVKFQYI